MFNTHYMTNPTIVYPVKMEYGWNFSISGLKMMVKSGLECFILKFTEPLQRYLLTCQANSAIMGRFFCTGQQQLWRGTQDFKIKNSRPLFNIIFKPKMVKGVFSKPSGNRIVSKIFLSPIFHFVLVNGLWIIAILCLK